MPNLTYSDNQNIKRIQARVGTVCRRGVFKVKTSEFDKFNQGGLKEGYTEKNSQPVAWQTITGIGPLRNRGLFGI